MEEENRNRDTNSHNENESELVLSVMRSVEAGVNGGFIPPPQSSTVAATTQTRRLRIEDDHLVSTVTVISQNDFLGHLSLQLESLSENVNIRELDNRWRGESVYRFRIRIVIDESDESAYEEREDYLTTFIFPENLIVVRFIQDFRQPNNGRHFSRRTQIVWNSKFTWRKIKQNLEDHSYNFDFIYEFIRIDMSQEIVNSSPTTEEDEEANNFRVAVDGLPEVISENGDGVMCAICQETFSVGESAKQLPCNHLYHSKCIAVWFRQSNSCPICRHEPVLYYKATSSHLFVLSWLYYHTFDVMATDGSCLQNSFDGEKKTVQLVERCSIFPVHPSPRQRSKLQIFDLQMLYRYYIQKVLIYPLIPKDDFQSTVELLKKSLSEVLVYFYPLAGRLTTLTDSAHDATGAGWSYTLFWLGVSNNDGLGNSFSKTQVDSLTVPYPYHNELFANFVLSPNFRMGSGNTDVLCYYGFKVLEG